MLLFAVGVIIFGCDYVKLKWHTQVGAIIRTAAMGNFVVYIEARV